jgi:uncharacterized protein (TIGR02270 family)
MLPAGGVYCMSLDMDSSGTSLPTPLAVSAVIQQHAADAAFLHSARTNLSTAPHIKLLHLRRFDDRLAAHLDGLAVAGEEAWPLCESALEDPTPSAVFTAAVTAIEAKSAERLNRLYALAEAVPAARPGLASAFGWVEQAHLRGIVVNLIASSNPYQRLLGISACAMHRLDMGRLRDAVLEGSDPVLRARALRSAGELGQRDVLPACMRTLDADDAESRFWACWSAVLLGNRGIALEGLGKLSDIPGPLRQRAFQLALQAMDQESCHAWLRALAQNPENLRWLIRGSGIAGDPTYVPWLIQHMADLKTARLAGEAFSLMMGLDLPYLRLTRKPPEQGAQHPNDDPNDANVDSDPDDGLPWPDPQRISRWWESNGGRYASGTRYFLGSPPTREHCLRALKEAYQRQRMLAAQYLCLLQPGVVLFEWRAPSARQQRLLAAMG